jgi:hypothetical protein
VFCWRFKSPVKEDAKHIQFEGSQLNVCLFTSLNFKKGLGVYDFEEVIREERRQQYKKRTHHKVISHKRDFLNHKRNKILFEFEDTPIKDTTTVVITAKVDGLMWEVTLCL